MNRDSMRPPQSEAPRSRAWIWAVLVGVLVVSSCIGGITWGVVAVVLPMRERSPKRTLQMEMLLALEAALAAEERYFREHGTYSESIKALGFLPDRGNAYRFYLSMNGPALAPGGTVNDLMTGVMVDYAKFPTAPSDAALRAALPRHLKMSLGVSGTCPHECWVEIVAIGNLDSDPQLDVWSISSKKRNVDGVTVPAGQTYQHLDDVSD